MKPSEKIFAELFEAKSINDLASLGSEGDLCKLLNQVYHPFRLDADTYEKIFAAIKAIRGSLSNLRSYPFVSRQAEAVFALTELEGKQRNDRLGFTEAMYKDRILSRQWYRSIAQLVHSDKIDGDPGPMQLLKDLYEMITHEPAPEE